MRILSPEGFPADRDEYVRRHGNERIWSLLIHKFFGRLQRTLPLAQLRLAFLRRLGVRVGENPPPWIGADVYVDDSFPELVTIESGVILGLRCMILCHDDATRIVAPVTVNRGAYVGAGAILLPGVVVGEESTIGAGAVVTRSVPPGQVWAGVPARPLHQSERDAAPSAVQIA